MIQLDRYISDRIEWALIRVLSPGRDTHRTENTLCH